MKPKSILGHKLNYSILIVFILFLFEKGTTEISSSGSKFQQIEGNFTNSTIFEDNPDNSTENVQNNFYWNESSNNLTDMEKAEHTFKELETKSKIETYENLKTKLSFNPIYWIIVGGIISVFLTSLVCSAVCGIFCAEPMVSSPEHIYQPPMPVVGLIGHYPTDPIMPSAPVPPPRRFPRHMHAGQSHERKSSMIISEIQIENSYKP